MPTFWRTQPENVGNALIARTLAAAAALLPAVAFAQDQKAESAARLAVRQCAQIVVNEEIRAAHPTMKHWREPPCRDVPPESINAVYMITAQFNVRL